MQSYVIARQMYFENSKVVDLKCLLLKLDAWLF